MTTIADLEEVQLQQHLISGGFLTSFTDIFGNVQDAPIVQLLEMDLTDIQESDRVVMIRNTGGISNPATGTFFVQRNMLISIVGQQGSTDSVIVKGLSKDMDKWLKQNITNGECMFNIQSSGVSGPFITEDSRRAYEINLQVSFNIDRPTF